MQSFKRLIPRTYFRNVRRFSSLENKAERKSLPDGPDLKDFLRNSTSKEIDQNDPFIPYLDTQAFKGWNRKVYFDVYGCQMNVNDTEIVWSILQSAGFTKVSELKEADVIMVMTCAIRENAEKKIWNRLQHFRNLKKARSKTKPPVKVAILGCMAERLKEKLIEKEKLIDIVAGPDSYKDLPRLLSLTETNEAAINVVLSQDETYADVMPVRLNENNISAFVSIMRGCNNMCTYCIVPFTRGRERSRPVDSILNEVKHLSEQGVREITLLGCLIFKDLSEMNNSDTKLAKGFKTVYKATKGGLRFAELLDRVASVDPQIRIRFTSPHPKDFPDEVLDVISSRKNICKNIHLPAQSGNSVVLERMRRGYTREAYLELVDHIRRIIPNVTLSSDFICGFCGETDEQFSDTVSLIEEVGYHVAYLFAYSMREESKRSEDFLAGRSDGNVKVIIPNMEVPEFKNSNILKPIQPGDYINVLIEDANSQVLKGKPLFHTIL